ncbi:MAG: hypothetical protein ABIV25_06800, partial [Paracoccaceae bacterium]
MFDTATSRFRRLAQSARTAEWNFLATEMSARMFFLDFFVFPPLVALGLFFAFWHGDAAQWAISSVLVLAGVAAWTLAEYLIHRFAFHHFPMLKA